LGGIILAYTKLRDLVALAIELQSSSIGLTIDEIKDRTERSRATVERMLTGLGELGVEVEQSRLETDHHLTKRWRIEPGMLPPVLFQFEPEERTALERVTQMKIEGQARSAIFKVLAGSPSLAKNLAIDQAELISRTAHLGQIGPSIRVQDSVMRTLEPCIQGFEEIRILYRSRGRPRAAWRKVQPHGLLFARFGYLVASMRVGFPLTFRLDLVQKAEALGTYFQTPEGWDFKVWSEESFGIFHGDKVLDVKLRFFGDAARRAERIKFHPSQRTERGRSGSLVVYLRCAGHRELIHELCHPDWLGSVRVEEPSDLKNEMRRYLREALKATV
jgi:predicted DNA-binding transcriptional regulator YafY